MQVLEEGLPGGKAERREPPASSSEQPESATLRISDRIQTTRLGTAFRTQARLLVAPIFGRRPGHHGANSMPNVNSLTFSVHWLPKSRQGLLKSRWTDTASIKHFQPYETFDLISIMRSIGLVRVQRSIAAPGSGMPSARRKNHQPPRGSAPRRGCGSCHQPQLEPLYRLPANDPVEPRAITISPARRRG